MPAFTKLFQYQVRAYTPRPETPTEDRWHQPWSIPVRPKFTKGAAIALMASGLFAPVLNPDTQITQTYESRWHQGWSEPVRVKRALAPSEHQFIAFVPVVTEVVTVDKWNYAWSEPVRIKPRLNAGLQQSLAWSTLTPEAIFIDKWAYPWSEPVRQKQGLRAHLQQALIAPVLDPDTQITQDYESRWHYAWSEPVRFRRFPPAEQQTFIFQPPSFEAITPDKWIYPWSEPVRQKPGLRAALQQTSAQTVLDPDTQITQNFESRWHYAWSEPVRLKRGLLASEQQFFAAPPRVFEIVTPDKWIYPWSEPVRQKIGLRSYLQQAFIAPVLNPETQIIQGYESRWHQPWSEPVRVRRFLAAQQQFLIQPATSVFESVTVDKWVYPWSLPVRFKVDPKRSIALAAPFTTLVLNPNTQITQNFESRWHYAWSEPVRLRRFPPAEQQTFAFQPPTFETVTLDKWVYPWSEPKRFRGGLGAWLQQASTPDTPLFPNLKQTIDWYEWLAEPVRSKPGLLAALQAYYYSSAAPVSVVVTVTLNATETNADRAFFYIRDYNPPVRADVSIKEIPDLRRANMSMEELDP